jgi:radical SAM protein with 4Fe4S-binding SPASM domain
MNDMDPILTEIKIEVTYQCRLSCIHCSSDALLSHPSTMSASDCTKIIQEAADVGVKNIAFSGGEPLLWEDLSNSVYLANKYNISTTLYTTGNVHDFKNIIITLKNSGLNKAIFSLFGATPQDHQAITRVSGSFSNTINAIRTSSTNNIQTELHFVPLKSNYRLLADIVELASSLGVKRISVLRFVPQGRGALLQKDILSKDENLELKRQIEYLRAKGYDIRTGSPYNFLLLNENPKCTSGFDKIIVDPESNIYPCDAFKQIKAKELVGNDAYSNLKLYSLKDCWFLSPFLKAVREYLSTPFEEPCVNCRFLRKCLSGCLAQKVIQNASLKKSKDPSCICD